MIYRMLSVCGALGYGYDETSLNEALKMKLDLIASDAGSMDAGPYYLGKGESYFSRTALKRDFSLMLKAALKQNCPLILGSCGMSGDDGPLDYMLEIVKEVFIEQQVQEIKVAVISAHIPPDLLKNEIDSLLPLGKMPALTLEMIQDSAIVGQMGIAPFMKALQEGAQVILCGRACDVAIFAAPAILNGVDPGIAYHAGHILECGALACDPGSASDCLIAECDGDTATFIAPNKNRKVTPKSIAAHSLYEESHPSLQFYPEGVLVMQSTDYFAKTAYSACIKNSLFVNQDLSLKIEGSQRIGVRYVSFLFCKPDNFPKDRIVYGYNGVQPLPVSHDRQEIGILIKVSSINKASATTLASLLKGYMLHYGYPDRHTTAGNIAFPLSPSQVEYQNEQGHYTSLVIAGTREPLFIKLYAEIKEKVLALAKTNFPDVDSQCQVEILTADATHPLLLLDTVGKTEKEASELHDQALATMQPFIDREAVSFRKIFGGEVYKWSIFHITKNSQLIKQLFPIKLYSASEKNWVFLKEVYPESQDIGIPISQYNGSINEKKLSIIQFVSETRLPIRYKALVDMATVIRSKDAGVNTITYDIFFNSSEDYQLALKSNVFIKTAIAKTLVVPEDLMIGTFQVDNCQAIKISRYRRLVSGSVGDHDVFGAQQQLEIERMQVPVFE